MKVYRFENRKSGKGMFTTCFQNTEHIKLIALQEEITNELMAHFDRFPQDLPDPYNEYKKTFNKDLVNSFDECFEFLEFVQTDAIFACPSIEKSSNWILNNEKLLDKMIKCGYFLYELELDTNQKFYNLPSQVIFKKENIIKRKVIHAKTILKEFLR